MTPVPDHDPTYTLAALKQCDRWAELQRYPEQKLIGLRGFDGKHFRTYFAPEGDLMYLLSAGKVECDTSPRLAVNEFTHDRTVVATPQTYWRALPDAD